MGTGFPGHLVWPAQPCTDGPRGQEQGVCPHVQGTSAASLPLPTGQHFSKPVSKEPSCHGVLLVVEDWEAQDEQRGENWSTQDFSEPLELCKLAL